MINKMLEAREQSNLIHTNHELKEALKSVSIATEGGTRMMDNLITVEVTYVKDDGVNVPNLLKAIRAMC